MTVNQDIQDQEELENQEVTQEKQESDKSIILNNFDKIEYYLIQKGISKELIHYFHIALLTKNFDEAGAVFGIYRETFSRAIKPLYTKMGIENGASGTKFSTLIDNLISIKVSSVEYQPFERSANQKIQILIAKKELQKAIDYLNNSIQNSIFCYDTIFDQMLLMGKITKAYTKGDDVDKI